MIKLNEILTEARGTCWKGYRQDGMKDKGGRQVPNCVPESVVKEAKPTTSSAPGQWVAFLSMTRGKKLLKTFDTARGAKMFLSKNVDKLLGGTNVESVGIMTKTQWDEREAKYAVEGINEATNKTFKIPTQRGILHIEVEEDPAGIFVDVIFNKVEVTMTDIQFPTGEVKITQKQKRVKLKEGINECGCGGSSTKLTSIVNESDITENMGISKMFKVYLGLQNKVRELEDTQKQLLQPYLDAKKSNNVTAINKAVDALKKNQATLNSARKNLTKVETKYIQNLDRDAELELSEAEDLLGNQWMIESVNESQYTDETNLKSSLLDNNEFTNLLTPKVFNWMRTPNIKIFNSRGSAYVVTDGKMEIVINKNKPMSVIKPIGRVRGEIKKLYTANE